MKHFRHLCGNNSRNPFCTLPVDIIQQIFHLINLKTLFSLFRTSMYFYRWQSYRGIWTAVIQCWNTRTYCSRCAIPFSEEFNHDKSCRYHPQPAKSMSDAWGTHVSSYPCCQNSIGYLGCTWAKHVDLFNVDVKNLSEGRELRLEFVKTLESCRRMNCVWKYKRGY